MIPTRGKGVPTSSAGALPQLVQDASLATACPSPRLKLSHHVSLAQAFLNEVGTPGLGGISDYFELTSCF